MSATYTHSTMTEQHPPIGPSLTVCAYCQNEAKQQDSYTEARTNYLGAVKAYLDCFRLGQHLDLAPEALANIFIARAPLRNALAFVKVKTGGSEYMNLEQLMHDDAEKGRKIVEHIAGLESGIANQIGHGFCPYHYDKADKDSQES